MFKFLRKSKRNFYFCLFLSFLIYFILSDFIKEKNIAFLENLLHAIVLAAVYAFFDWAWNSGNHKKKGE